MLKTGINEGRVIQYLGLINTRGILITLPEDKLLL